VITRLPTETAMRSMISARAGTASERTTKASAAVAVPHRSASRVVMLPQTGETPHAGDASCREVNYYS